MGGRRSENVCFGFDVVTIYLLLVSGVSAGFTHVNWLFHCVYAINDVRAITKKARQVLRCCQTGGMMCFELLLWVWVGRTLVAYTCGSLSLENAKGF